jgi:hypothetical protein
MEASLALFRGGWAEEDDSAVCVVASLGTTASVTRRFPSAILIERFCLLKRSGDFEITIGAFIIPATPSNIAFLDAMLSVG